MPLPTKNDVRDGVVTIVTHDHDLQKDLQLTSALRRKIGGAENVKDTLPLGTVSGNVYVDKARHCAVGVDSENGRSPKKISTGQQSASVGVKVKF